VVEHITVATRGRGLHEITAQVEGAVRKAGIAEGLPGREEVGAQRKANHDRMARDVAEGEVANQPTLDAADRCGGAPERARHAVLTDAGHQPRLAQLITERASDG